MEMYFLILLILIMVFALTSGFPVAFSLPGAAIITIALAALCGYLFEGNTDAYFLLGPGRPLDKSMAYDNGIVVGSGWI